MASFAERINECLETKGISAYRMSKDTGISERLIGYWKKGEKTAGGELLAKAAEYFDVSTDYLLGRDEPTPTPQIQVAALEGLDEDEMDEVLRYAEFIKSQRNKK